MGLSKFFDPNVVCYICNEKTGLNSFNLPGGRICWNCQNCLSKKKINLFGLKKYELSDLREMCGIVIYPEIIIEENETAVDSLNRLKIDAPILLKNGESCFYMEKASAVYSKNVITGTKNKGTGVSLRVTRGVSIRTGGGKSNVVRENINEYFDGKLYITNLRIILLTPKHGFDVSIPKITTISWMEDGFMLYIGSKCHTVYTKDVKNIMTIIKLMNQATKEQKNSPN